MAEREANFEREGHYTIMFADVKGSSALRDFDYITYLDEVLPIIAGSIHQAQWRPAFVNTWGDGVMAYFTTASAAALCALDLRDTFRNTEWRRHRLPNLQIRIGLHSGNVFKGYNAVTRRNGDIFGSEVILASRVEPIVAANHVFATSSFVNHLAQAGQHPGVEPHLLGTMKLAKNWPSEEIFVLGRQHEIINTRAVRIEAETSDPSTLFNYFATMPYGKRLSIASYAKALIADYCIRSGFWRPDETVFIESGTLPLFMVIDVFRKLDPDKRPRLLVTNNVACAMASMLEDVSVDDYPHDPPTRASVLAGRVLGGYAATIPEDLFDGARTPVWKAERALDYLRRTEVRHVVMIVSKLTTAEGPCVKSKQMRRFKKLLLHYVHETPNVRLSILCEAEKLIEKREAWPADEQDLPLPNAKGNRFWNDLLTRNYSVKIVTALSPALKTEDIGRVKDEVSKLKDAGASCVLLDCFGEPVAIP